MSSVKSSPCRRRRAERVSAACTPRRKRVRAEQIERARQLLSLEVSFIPHSSFRRKSTSFSVPAPIATAAKTQHRPWLLDLPAHLARMGETPLLTAEEERTLFQQMNYWKYRANSLRTTLDPESPDVPAMDQIEEWLELAQTVRDQIVRANLRLVMAVVKKFVSPQQTFDDLLSDGIVTLLKAVEKFDFSRGFRFSTYCYRALLSNISRSVAVRANRESRYVALSDELSELNPDNAVEGVDERAWSTLGQRIETLLTSLNPRERYIVSGRFAIGDHAAERTLQSLANELGISKERVRQIERRAMARLKAMAETMDWEAVV